MTATLGGYCLCERGQAIGTIAWTSGRVWFRAFHDGPVAYHHENAADWACVDCVADIAVAVASGDVRETMVAAARHALKERRAAAEVARAFAAVPVPGDNPAAGKKD